MKSVWLCFMNSPIWLPVRAMHAPARARFQHLSPATIRRTVSLRFRPDDTFTIVQLTDVHWKNGEPDGPADARAHRRRTRPRASRPRGPDRRHRGRGRWPRPGRGLPAGGGADRGARPSVGRGLRQPRRRRAACPASSSSTCSGRAGAASPAAGRAGSRASATTCCGSAARDTAAGRGLYFLDSGAYIPDGVGEYAWIARDQIELVPRTSRRSPPSTGPASCPPWPSSTSRFPSRTRSGGPRSAGARATSRSCARRQQRLLRGPRRGRET